MNDESVPKSPDRRWLQPRTTTNTTLCWTTTKSNWAMKTFVYKTNTVKSIISKIHQDCDECVYDCRETFYHIRTDAHTHEHSFWFQFNLTRPLNVFTCAGCKCVCFAMQRLRVRSNGDLDSELEFVLNSMVHRQTNGNVCMRARTRLRQFRISRFVSRRKRVIVLSHRQFQRKTPHTHQVKIDSQ